jgi:purine-binding chemotaxis protein CheW
MAEIYVNSLNQIIGKEDQKEKDKKLNSAIQIIRFFIDDFEFALDIMDVKEIKENETIRHLPNSLPFVKGLLNLRGDIIPVLDLKKRLELENLTLDELANLAKEHDFEKAKDQREDKNYNKKQEADEEQNTNPSIIICRVGSDNFGIVVDRIVRVQYLSVDEYEPTPTLFENIGKNFIKGFAKLDKKVIVILSLENLFF